MVRPQTVLIVDDDPRLLDCLAVVLRGHQFLVATAKNGFYGYASYFRDPTDWIITDIEMPQLNGLEMVRCIRAIEPSVKVIYTSGAVDKHRARLDEEASQFNARILDKPFSFNQILDLLAKRSGAPRKSRAPENAKRRPSSVTSGSF